MPVLHNSPGRMESYQPLLTFREYEFLCKEQCRSDAVYRLHTTLIIFGTGQNRVVDHSLHPWHLLLLQCTIVQDTQNKRNKWKILCQHINFEGPRSSCCVEILSTCRLMPS